MAKMKRTKIQRENDLLTISARYLQGVTQFEIAQELGVSQQQISYDIKTLQTRWLQSSLVNVDEAKAQELAKIDRLEREYWTAWKDSQLDAEVQTIEQQGVVKDADGKVVGNRIKKTDRKEGQSGNPAFLRGVEWCINKRCEILGLDAPKKIAPTDPSGDNPYMNMEAAELMTIVRKLADAGNTEN